MQRSTTPAFRSSPGPAPTTEATSCDICGIFSVGDECCGKQKPFTFGEVRFRGKELEFTWFDEAGPSPFGWADHRAFEAAKQRVISDMLKA